MDTTATFYFFFFGGGRLWNVTYPMQDAGEVEFAISFFSFHQSPAGGIIYNSLSYEVVRYQPFLRRRVEEGRGRRMGSSKTPHVRTIYTSRSLPLPINYHGNPPPQCLGGTCTETL